jgi:SPP1 gp7 family putative phage head morphogenesis protein
MEAPFRRVIARSLLHRVRAWLKELEKNPGLLDDEAAVLPEDYKALEATHDLLMRSCLMGMDAAGRERERHGADFADDPLLLPDAPIMTLPYEEALDFLQTQIPLTKKAYYDLDDKLRLRAFTVGRLNDGDAVNRVKGIIRTNLERGGTLSDFYKMTDAEILDGLGFGERDMSYWETVYRTNEATAHNAGRAMDFEAFPPAALELVGIRDARQSDICAELTRQPFIRPYNDPVWQSLWPPFHFNCRTTVRGIYDTAELDAYGGTEKVYALGTKVKPQKGFGGYPLDKESYWRLTPEMADRARKYGIDGEIVAAAEKLGIKDYTLPGGDKQKIAKEADGFREAKTIAEANDFAKNVMGIDADYSGCNVAVANEWNKGVYDALREFPELKEDLRFIGTVQARNKRAQQLLEDHFYRISRSIGFSEERSRHLAQGQARSYIRKEFAAGVSYAQSLPKGMKLDMLDSIAGITVNGKGSTNFVESLKREVALKFHPKGCDTIKSLVDHELGHQLDEFLKISGDEAIKKLYEGTTHSGITDGLSEYAWNNGSRKPIREFVAEGWAEYKNNPRPRPLAREIGEFILRRYASWKQ